MMGQQIRQLWGHGFPLVKEGLSEAVVVAYVNKIVEERDALAKNQEHLVHLRQLAERMVMEADKMSVSIKEQTEVESTAMIALARQKAEEMVNEAGQVVTAANKKADDILDKAGQEATLLKAKMREEIQRGFSASLAKLTERVKKLAIDVEKELTDEISGLGRTITDVPESTGLANSDEPHGSEQRIPDHEFLFENAFRNGEEEAASSLIQDEPLLPSRPIYSDTDVSGISSKSQVSLLQEISIASEQPAVTKSESNLYYGRLKLIIAPPLKATKILELAKKLSAYSDIQIGGITTSSSGLGTMSLTARKPLDLISILRQIEGLTADGTLTDDPEDNKSKILHIRLDA